MTWKHFNKVSDVNKLYRDLWKEYRNVGVPVEIKKYLDIWPIQYDTQIKQQSLLFVGLNPSYDDKSYTLELADNRELDDDAKIENAIEDERTAQRGKNGKERYSYYTQFPLICQALGINKEDWNHIDLLPFREKNQNELLGAFQLENRSFSDWFIANTDKEKLIKECVEIFLCFIELLKPKTIVIANGFISRKIIEHTGFYYSDKREISKIEYHFSDDKLQNLYLSKSPDRCHRYIEIENKYPLVLTSMLTGQRALDLASRERLICDIKQLLDEID